MTAVNCDETPREKRLTHEEMERHIARVTAIHPPAEIRDPFEVCPTKHLSSEEIARVTDRLYSQSIERRAASIAQADHALYGNIMGASKTATGGASKLDPEEEERLVKRLYSQSMQNKQASVEKLRQQYLFHPPASPPKVPLNAFVQHMYNDRLEAKKKAEKRLHDLYIAPTEIHTGTISKSHAEESANRLSSRSGGA
ncbi:hypothetical protein ABL78_7695 [Leptomonas seymouri]|uniref:Uncharacterized protein n=1 Tax=Leptomonas seymouri TaxID=5684 RepID=A0A0N1HS21_LEPSE|nr:hypothetical protein ABL78_7695 [Leptomonas seymouri]|eukprot:KPI83281.1 hypothetical protein ABL78_7695 [Leptomonas seymouri]